MFDVEDAPFDGIDGIANVMLPVFADAHLAATDDSDAEQAPDGNTDKVVAAAEGYLVLAVARHLDDDLLHPLAAFEVAEQQLWNLHAAVFDIPQRLLQVLNLFLGILHTHLWF